MKNISMTYGVLVFLIFFGFQSVAQVIIQPQVPSQGIVQQSQLWSLLVINNENNPLRASIELVFEDQNTHVKVLSGRTGVLFFPKGVNQITTANLGSVQYEYLNGGSPGGLLPIGRFDACYTLFPEENKLSSPISPECVPVTVEPFSPPQLVVPEDGAVENTSYPVLNWLSPMPTAMFTDLNYKLIITEVYNGQAPTLAIQRNPVLYVQDQIKQTSLVYPSSYVALQPGKTYAWQIIAQNGSTWSQATDVWSFKIKKDSILFFLDNAAYPHLQRGAGSSLYGASEKIKFSYENEAGDSAITARLVQKQGTQELLISSLSLPLKRGVNFIDIDLASLKKLIRDQEYVLELTNGWKENWDLRFIYQPKNN